MRSPLHDNHTDASYEEDNREMRAEHKKDTGKTLELSQNLPQNYR